MLPAHEILSKRNDGNTFGSSVEDAADVWASPGSRSSEGPEGLRRDVGLTGPMRSCNWPETTCPGVSGRAMQDEVESAAGSGARC
jgi:hypothetical protein